ncbi:MAG: SpoIID/LytB domain-containing protein [Spirochaetes bacterium]|nr:SpoIID/LytB domain-containing protein [Spirochaetota bacterium]
MGTQTIRRRHIIRGAAFLIICAALFPAEIRVLMSDMKAPFSVKSESGLSAESGAHVFIASNNEFRIDAGRDGVSVSGYGIYRQVDISSAAVIRLNGISLNGTVRFIPHNGSVAAIAVLDLEEYVRGVLPYEMQQDWPLEALKAQALTARSYALHHMLLKKKDTPYDVDNTTKYQVYRGIVPGASNVNAAVAETEGEVIIYRGHIIPAYFHASCGGYTESTYRIFGVDIPYLRGCPCYYCGTNARHWSFAVTKDEFAAKLAQAAVRVGAIHRVAVIERNRSGRVDAFLAAGDAGSKKINGGELRKLMGAGRMQSLAFDVKLDETHVRFSGTGNGHGVGMCQWGAYGMALAGLSYKDVVFLYYKTAEIHDYRILRTLEPDIWKINETYLNSFTSH